MKKFTCTHRDARSHWPTMSRIAKIAAGVLYAALVLTGSALYINDIINGVQ